LAVLLISVLCAAPEPLPQDKGAAGTWQRLLKLQTTASAMHTTAHPDDEHGGMLAQLSRGRGARVSLLTLNRGESGDNAIGSELFDAVGLIRTEELLMSGRYYGLDRQYFATVIDYGFSKRLEETIEKWGRETVLRDVVRIIRRDRPFVLIARFQGNERDGHGNHQAAGLITQDAFKAAADPAMFPEPGVSPWQALKLYMGGVQEDEAWTLRTDTGEYSAWLGDSYQNFSRVGLSFQRSQNGGRLMTQPGPSFSYYKRLASLVDAPAKEQSFFDGIDTSIPGLFTAIRRPAPAAAGPLLAEIDTEVKTAVQAFSLQDPSACVPPLVRGLAAIRKAIALLAAEPDAVFILDIKERQFVDAINAALGIELQALAQPAGSADGAAMRPVVPGQRIEIRVALANRGTVNIEPTELSLANGDTWQSQTTAPVPSVLGLNQIARRTFTASVPERALLARPYFERASIAETRYTVRDTSQLYRPAAEPALSAQARYLVAGVPVAIRSTVRRREPHLPYGDELRELMVVPTVAVNVTPRAAVVPLAASSRVVEVSVELVGNMDRSSGQLALRLPAGWTSTPPAATFSFSRAGERSTHRFSVSVPSLDTKDYRVEAVATVSGRQYSEGYDVIEHRDLETRYLFHPAAIQVRGIDVKIVPGLKVGYVMGIGDEVPAGIAQLGAAVTLLGEQDLATSDLRQYDAIMTGTRAYAVREDLKTYNRRLLDYVKDGGNLIVLYNTQEFVPDRYAPFPGQLPSRAEEVSEEDSPVEILAASHKAFNTPNRITKADFDGWVEQRGSKFFTEWDAAYTPMISTYDKGQSPQRGGWLTADYGKGHYTYFAYAFHRQLPYGVPGAYRLLANLLSLGK
jgi:LmbE family N-acetylglucosaminyl deacetylase